MPIRCRATHAGVDRGRPGRCPGVLRQSEGLWRRAPLSARIAGCRGLWGAPRTMTSGCRQELLSLHLPLDWKWLQEPCEPSGRPPVHGALDDVRCEQSEAENPAGIGEADTFRFRQLSDRSEPALVQHPLPSPRPGQCLDQRAIGLRLPRRRKLASVRARRYASGRCDVGTAKAVVTRTVPLFN